MKVTNYIEMAKKVVEDNQRTTVIKNNPRALKFGRKWETIIRGSIYSFGGSPEKGFVFVFADKVYALNQKREVIKEWYY